MPENKKLNEGYFEAQNRLFEAHPEMKDPAFWDEGAPRKEIPQNIVDEYEAMLDEDDDEDMDDTASIEAEENDNLTE